MEKSIFDLTREVDAQYGTNLTRFAKEKLRSIRSEEHTHTFPPVPDGRCAFCGRTRAEVDAA